MVVTGPLNVSFAVTSRGGDKDAEFSFRGAPYRVRGGERECAREGAGPNGECAEGIAEVVDIVVGAAKLPLLGMSITTGFDATPS